jgi:EmrB/QacA subfamily drug resistance transporter
VTALDDQSSGAALAAGAAVAAGPPGASNDRARWVTLGVVVVTPVIVALDSTVLNVSLPTISRDLHTSIPSLEWVITGFALVLATLLMIGGRLGDLFGHRQVFLAGIGLFGIGSLIAALSASMPQLLIGEAVIEGVGASLMMPASLAILSNMFTGRERAMAFAAWGAGAGGAASLGPVVGGFLTTNASWRWSFGINVIVAPIAILLALMFIPKLPRARSRPKIDLLGASLVGLCFFGVVFAVSEGTDYGWVTPVRRFTGLWPTGRPVSVTVLAAVLAVAAGAAFYVHEQRLKRTSADPLFDFALFRKRSFRSGMVGVLCVSVSTAVLSFSLPIFLQAGRQLSAQQNGLWQFPFGFFVLVGAQVGGRLVRRFGITVAVRCGLVSLLLGLLAMRIVLSPSITWWHLLPACVFVGAGVGISSAQLTSVVLSEVREHKMGVASAANSTFRYVGVSLGVAVSGSFMLGRVSGIAQGAFARLSGVRPGVQADAIAAVRAQRSGFEVPAGASAHERTLLDHAFGTSLASASYTAIYIGMAVCVVAMLVTTRLPQPDGAVRDAVELPH